jgi:hypothetical protein
LSLHLPPVVRCNQARNTRQGTFLRSIAGAGLDNDQKMLAEQSIASRSDWFVGNVFSTTTLFVLEERHLNGLPLNSSYMWGDPVPLSRSPWRAQGPFNV